MFSQPFAGDRQAGADCPGTHSNHLGDLPGIKLLDNAQVDHLALPLGKLVDRYAGVAVLKGSGTLVSSASGAAWICTAGNPGMAAPGMGDVLTGIIAALIAQGLTPEEGAAIGVEVHARAGDRAAEQGERGLLASDLLAQLRGVVNL